ncbi:MAG: exodeoxyribonuclease III [Candidatus Magasanikbacteria bacterium CG_4_9_14_0_2_um_filter_41_10]|uniref:Exodeoxyribonuclease III n=1 Tax=Candidatus Magasanikbacteria bacterium CG_4_10_14_0_2_um_filter_41_31 TaxID=1974639 RepID=A0A2M7V1N0_9BACT|nr:MAG: exodeoxyribonuclease III [Candidatus Magasanikbacteria bacterium CG1_02_41_34]PIZ92251.1 MAG: exodeoxyribonuclease III [Candidatus Magasanikbacteria bacterium CG_4_10_14_0_2_um_filter_41_31]PJC53119.1 MAG: exodeoxyribonuclease III [Candidatus Magasanikbacteria bacterium CG_4_9_14_0_2_um_filter_41_10]
MKNSTLSIFSWNVNGIRAGLKKGTFQEFIQKHKPDILCLQETKASKNQVEIDLPDYTEYWHSAKKKGYSGTAIFSKIPATSVIYGLLPNVLKKFHLTDNQDRDGASEGRVLSAEFEKFYVVSVYTPNTKDDLSRLSFRHKKWDPAFLMHVKELEKNKPVIFCGDLNVAHEEIDLARPKENIGKHGFTDEEREGFDNIVAAGFVDTFRDKYPDNHNGYTWWSHFAKARERNVGWRIDYVCVSKTLQKNIDYAFILPEVMGSDHCPIGISLQL